MIISPINDVTISTDLDSLLLLLPPFTKRLLKYCIPFRFSHFMLLLGQEIPMPIALPGEVLLTDHMIDSLEEMQQHSEDHGVILSIFWESI